jgi:hypothetical protein
MIEGSILRDLGVTSLIIIRERGENRDAAPPPRQITYATERYPLNTKLGESQSQPGHFEEEEKIFSLRGIQPLLPLNLVIKLTELFIIFNLDIKYEDIVV